MSAFTAQARAGVEELSARDPDLKVFGALSHRYELNPLCEQDAIESFEHRYGVTLPGDYRDFLTLCGNGGAGPFYGVFPLGFWDGSGWELEEWKPSRFGWGSLRRPFPHSEHWNLSEDRLNCPKEIVEDDDAYDAWQSARDDEQYCEDLTDGAMPICHEGCAYRSLLIVTGPQRGRMWLDGRASDQGIGPYTSESGTAPLFSEWYLSWINRELDKLKHRPSS